MIRSVSARRTLSPTVGPNICAYAARFILWGIFSASSVNPNNSSSRNLWQRSHHRLVEPVSQARSAVGDQRNFTGLSWLEPHRGSRRDIQAITESSLSIEREGCVGFSKMVVTADLDRSV